MSAASSTFHQARQATQEALWLAAHIQFSRRASTTVDLVELSRPLGHPAYEVDRHQAIRHSRD